MSEHVIDLSQLASKARSHSIFAPSSAAMWLNCAGSLIPNILAPEDAGEEAAEGTVAHAVAETWLKSGKRPNYLIGKKRWIQEGDKIFVIEITELMLDYVEEYVDWCTALPGRHYTEVRVDFSQITPIPNQGGTADHAACSKRKLVITDLKFGKGIRVYAKRNPQAMLYGIGALYRWDWLYQFEEIEIRICQPRMNHFDVWHTTKDELIEFSGYVKARAETAWKLNATRTPSEYACQWCKVSATCAARASQLDDIDDAMLLDASDYSEEAMQETKLKLRHRAYEVKMGEASELKTPHIAKILQHKSNIEKWLKLVQQEATKRANTGEELEGWRLGAGRGSRKFKAEMTAVRALRRAGLTDDQIYERKLVTPAQGEELLRTVGMKKKEAVDYLEDYWIKSAGKPVLMRQHDARDELPDDDAILEDETR